MSASLARDSAASRLRASVLARLFLDLAHAHAALDDVLRELECVRLADELARVAGRQFARAHQRLHRLGQFEQPHHVRHMRPALADDLRHFVLAVIELFHQRQIAARLFDRVEVGALHVFDDGEFQRLPVGRFHHDDRHVVLIGALRRAPAPLAGDDLEAVVARGLAHDDRLDDAVLADRGGKLVELGVGKGAARVARIGFQVFDRRAPRLARRIGRLAFLADIADQRSKAASQSRMIRHRRRS